MICYHTHIHNLITNWDTLFLRESFYDKNTQEIPDSDID
ncbi:hypothetical protein XBFFL1_770057 [Xenorhabdus bovienii str. feltiae Florida]|uniref:Uncharacterized protein n=1 Tax=Xenorhabdus bovienii str. kraussei Becker Underwood TaxID=1398204 RepID=A0A077PFA0_XENBV|nr:hypothetical protein XBFFL1_770057 [Xenorhabdus bovienii str. feltiae Florida]CDH22990.1 hypothetical protein XBKB1_1420064 [Xenorhabdus bovienii str. kraussei Becker Underwood]